MTKPSSTNISTKIPFGGFYDSIWSSALDQEQEQFAENEADAEQKNALAPELKLKATHFAEALADALDYGKACEYVARDYAETFSTILGEELGLDDLGLTFEEMTSPRFYNFETDRIFVSIPFRVVEELFKRSEADNHHRTLGSLIEKRFTSRSGFASYYSNKLADWLEKKPLDQWDHNEIETLLLANMSKGGVEDIENDVYDRMYENFYHAMDQAVDWSKYETRISFMRASRLEEIRAEQPDYVPPPTPPIC